jgi:hypothetical protein
MGELTLWMSLWMEGNFILGSDLGEEDLTDGDFCDLSNFEMEEGIKFTISSSLRYSFFFEISLDWMMLVLLSSLGCSFFLRRRFCFGGSDDLTTEHFYSKGGVVWKISFVREILGGVFILDREKEAWAGRFVSFYLKEDCSWGRIGRKKILFWARDLEKERF